MKCVIPNGNLNMFSRMFHTLAKFGDSVFIEFHSNHMLLQSYNLSQSAFGSFIFQTKFFSTYISEKEPVKCKIALKSCFLAFKSQYLEKVVEECHLDMEEGADELCIHFHCKRGIVKSFKLPFIDFELLSTNFSKNKCKNYILSPSRVLNDCVQNFLSTVDEVTLKVSNEKVSMKNFTDDLPDPSKIVYTEKRLEFDEFLEYKFHREVDLTFCLKEFKSILAFADFGKSNLPISIYFNESGDGIIFSVSSEQEWESNFILATLKNENDNADTPRTTTSTAQSSNVVDSGNPIPEENIRGKVTDQTENISKSINILRNNSTKSQNVPVLSADSSSNKLSSFINNVNTNISHEPQFASNKISQSNNATFKTLNKTRSSTYDSKMCSQFEGASQYEKEDNGSRELLQHEHQSELNVPLIDLTQDEPDNTQPLHNESSDEFDDTIPASPPAKRFKHIFLAKNQNCPYTSQAIDDEVVLAPDSDEETI